MADTIDLCREIKDANGDVCSRFFHYTVDVSGTDYEFSIEVCVSDAASAEDAKTLANTRAAARKAEIAATLAHPAVTNATVVGEVTL